MKNKLLVIFFAFILITTLGAPHPAHASGSGDVISSVINGAIDIGGNLIDNVTSITSGVIQGSINLIVGGSFSEGYKQGFCALGGGGYGLLTGGDCTSTDSTTTGQFWKITSSSGANGAITPSGDTIVENGLDVSYVVTPSVDWQIDSLMVDGAEQSDAIKATNSYTFSSVAADHTISVTFRVICASGTHWDGNYCFADCTGADVTVNHDCSEWSDPSADPPTCVGGGTTDIVTHCDGTWEYKNDQCVDIECPVATGPPVIDSYSASSITTTSATLNANISSVGVGATSVTVRYFCWFRNSDFTGSLGCSDNGAGGVGVYSHDVTGLSPGTTYYYFATTQNNLYINDVSNARGSFTTTTAVAVPVVTVSWTPSTITTADTSQIAVTSSDPSATCSATLTGVSPWGPGAITNPFNNNLGPFSQGTETATVSCTNAGGPGTASADLTINSVPVPYNTLSVATAGTGTGVVTGSGITCTRPSAGGDTCSLSFASGTSVTLTASPTSGNSVSWTGCDSTSGNACTVSMTTAKSVIATFDVASSMSGSLSVTTPSPCILYVYESSCRVDLSWNITYPEGKSSIISSNPSGLDYNGASDPPSFHVTMPVVGEHNPTSFYLYNNSKLIAQKDVVVVCDTNTSWNGSYCAPTAPTTYTLSVGTAGTGTGAVTGSGITCTRPSAGGDTCSLSFASGTSVTLTASPTSGNSVSWTGCDSTSGNACTVSMTTAKSVIATFTLPPPPGGATSWWSPSAITIPYGGTLPAISYDSTNAVNCSIYDKADGSLITSAFGTSHTFPVGTFTGSPFTTSSWGRKLVCFNSANAPSADAFLNVTVCASGQTVVGGVCTAPTTYTLSVGTSGTGTGAVTGSGITCTRPSAGGDTCSLSFASGTSVTLTASPTSGNSVSWTGCDSTSGNACTVSMTTAKSVIATFTAGAGGCGTAATNYASSATAYSGTYCSTSYGNSSIPAFPAVGSSSNWYCKNSVGTNDAYCTATHVGCVPGCSPTKASTFCLGQSFGDGCGGTCLGTRSCGSSWKEVAP